MAKMSDVAPVTEYQLVQLASVAVAVGRAENVPLTAALRWLSRQVDDGQLSARLYDIPISNGYEISEWSAASDDRQWKLIEKRAVARQWDADKMPTIAQSRYLHVDDLAQLAASTDTSEACRAALLELVEQRRVRPRDAAEPASVIAQESPSPEDTEPGLPAEQHRAAHEEPPALTTRYIAMCFGGLRYTEERWMKPLGDKPNWLRACIVAPGARGVRETKWNPVLIGGALVLAMHVAVNRVRARFQTQPMLKPWLDAWKTYEADYIDSD